MFHDTVKRYGKRKLNVCSQLSGLLCRSTSIIEVLGYNSIGNIESEIALNWADSILLQINK